eukprot:NODE_10_length_61504_cov_0.956502.p2 type:complete len:816 gc:universal NODE_10_length_61504_cov_0.956502:47517-49964(+)
MLIWCIYGYIAVQTQLLEGYASKSIGFDKFTGIRTVFTSKEFSMNPKVIIETSDNLNIIMDRGNHMLEEIEMIKNTNYTFVANAADRISFFVKVDRLKLMDLTYYYEGKSYLLHLDMDVIEKIRTMELPTIIKMFPNINHHLAYSTLNFVKKLLSGAVSTIENGVSHLINYNSTKTQIQTIEKRDIHKNYKRMIEVLHPSHLIKRDSVFSDIGEFIGNTTHQVYKNLHDVFQYIVKKLEIIGIHTRYLLSVLKDMYHWEHIRRVQQVMVHYCTIIKDGIFESIDFVDLKLFEHFSAQKTEIDNSMIKKQISIFDSIMEGKSIDPVIDAKVKESREHQLVHQDARSSFIDDMYTQNVAKASMSGDPNITDIHNLGKQFFDEIKNHIDLNDTSLQEIPKRFLRAWEDDTLKHSDMKTRLKYVWFTMSSSIFSLSSSLGSKIFSALIKIFKNFVKLYWSITHYQIHIPLVSEFLHYTVGLPLHATMLDAWTTMGAMLFTFTFRMYKNKFPISEYDKNVLLDVKSPYLLVWAWENDPMTGPPSKDGFYKKSCMLDWMTKALTLCARLFAYSVSRVVKRQTKIYVTVRMFMGTGVPKQTLKSNWNKNQLPWVWGITNYIFSFNNFLSANLRFPFDYLDTNDPIAIREQMRKPDRDRWLYWIIRYPRTLFYIMRPFLEERYRNTNPLLLETFKFVVNGALKWTILPRNIVDLYKGIDIKDYRRFWAWFFTSTYWIMSMFGDIADLVIAFFDPSYYKKGAGLKYLPPFLRGLTSKNSAVISSIKDINDWTDFLSNFFCFLRYQTYIGFGMSGWYGTIRNVTF